MDEKLSAKLEEPDILINEKINGIRLDSFSPELIWFPDLVPELDDCRNELALKTKELEKVNKELLQLREKYSTVDENIQRLDFLTNNSEDAVFEITTDGIITSWNKAARRIYGYRNKEIIGKPIGKILLPESEKLMMKFIKKIKSGHAKSMEFKTVQANRKGRMLHISGRVAAVGNGKGELCGIIVINRDNSRQFEDEKKIELAKEDAKKISRAKDEFLANISHEVRTPLNSIIGFADLLLESELPENSLESLTIIRQSGKNLMTILNDVLDLTSIEAGNLELSDSVIPVRSFFSEVINSYRGMCNGKGLKLIWELDPLIPENMIVDYKRLRQVIGIILGNAVKFTDKGGITIYMGMDKDKSYSAGNIGLYLWIADTGIGIPKSQKNKVFDSFFQVDGSCTRRHGGAGIGLHLCKKIIELMGGRIWVESQEGKGSRFHFVAPVKIDVPSGKSVKTRLPGRKNLPQFRILLAEDDISNQLMMRKILEKSGHQVDVAFNGKDAVNQFRAKKNYDIVLMDVQMPGMDGLKASALIREYERENNGGRIPIIALTAFAMQGDEKMCLDAGMDYYLPKPLRKEHLFRILENIASK